MRKKIERRHYPILPFWFCHSHKCRHFIALDRRITSHIYVCKKETRNEKGEEDHCVWALYNQTN